MTERAVKDCRESAGKGRNLDIAVTEGSDHVFADLGFAEPDEELTKAKPARHIRAVLQRQAPHPGRRGGAGC